MFSLGQALIASQAGCNIRFTFIGRLDDNGQDGIQIVKSIVDMFEKQNYQTKVLAASIRNKTTLKNVLKSAFMLLRLPYRL